MDTKKTIIAATLQLLHPIIRLLLRNGVSHSEFAEIAKRAYIDVAYADFSIPGKKKTVSRAAVITGLSRKEVLRMTEVKGVEEPRKGSINRANRVINGWLRDKEFLNNKGKSKSLPLSGDEGSFASLVKKYSGDITAGAVLDELVRTGVVKKLANEKVKLNAAGYIPNKDKQEQFRIMGNCATDFLNTLDHNLAEESEELYFQRHVAYSNLPVDILPEFKKLSREKSIEFLVDLNKWLAQYDAIATPSEEHDEDPKIRAGFGVYYFEDKVIEDETEDEENKNEN